MSLLRYVVSGDVRCVSSLSLDSGTLVMFGTGDGALTSLALADPDKKDTGKTIKVMRQTSSCRGGAKILLSLQISVEQTPISASYPLKGGLSLLSLSQAPFGDGNRQIAGRRKRVCYRNSLYLHSSDIHS